MTHNRAENLFTGPIAEEYELLRLICPAVADMSRRVGDFVAALPKPEPGRTLEVLEIGCGTGVTTLNLLQGRSDLRITALDFSGDMLDKARRNLAPAIADGQVRLVESDALSELLGTEAESFDLVASGFAIHNFMDGYRGRVLAEILRVLKPGGVFVNGDRYALDDPEAHLLGVQEEVRGWFRVFLEMNRPDMLEEWIVHLYSDESPHHVMRLAPAVDAMKAAGFDPVEVHYREGAAALVSGARPWR
jgi:ubiquinone/menaquinone biosynthesis C-methylase UbiE